MGSISMRGGKTGKRGKKEGGIWWIRYRRAGRLHQETSRSTRKKDAIDLLRSREGDIARGLPVTPKVGNLRYEEMREDLLNDYRTNRKRSLAVTERRIQKHLDPFFTGWRAANITAADVRRYTAQRQADGEVVTRAYTCKDGRKAPERRRKISGASNGEINRELQCLKRMFSLAVQSGKLLHKPHIPMLAEAAARSGFFEPEQIAGVLAHLPAEIASPIAFALATGWRIPSEVLPLQWRQVDFAAGEVRLDPGSTKNGEGRVFPMTADLRTLLEARHAEHLRLKQAGVIVPQVFFREIADGRGGDKHPRPITAFGKAWKTACRLAGCPGKIPHDLRRTAVRNFVRAGIPERVAMQLSGHKTRSVFERYNIVSDGDLREAARKLDARAEVHFVYSRPVNRLNGKRDSRNS